MFETRNNESVGKTTSEKLEKKEYYAIHSGGTKQTQNLVAIFFFV